MKTIPLLKAISYLVIAVVMMFFYPKYDDFIMHSNLPEKLLYTAYRVLIAFCLIESVRLIIIFSYQPVSGAKRDNFTIGIGHLAKILYSLLLISLILSVFNISLKEALTSLSLIAAAVVLMTKDYIANLINGMYLTFARVINIGDNVELGDHKGKILDITLTNVHLLNDDDDIIYIPNNKVFSNEIINYTRRHLKKSSIEFELSTRYAPPAEELEQMLIESLKDFSKLIREDSYNLKVKSIQQDHIAYKFQFILMNPLDKEDNKKIRRHLVQFMTATIAKLRDKSRSEQS